MTLIDYPGRMACTIFSIGCNFRCPFCYSTELVLPEKTAVQPRVSEEEFFAFLKERQGLLEGCVVCGGEPTFHQDLPEFIAKIKKLGYKIKLDTNGSNPKILEDLIDNSLLDYVAMDVKACKEKYAFYTGGKVDLSNIEKSVAQLKKRKISFEFRTTVAPGLTKDDLTAIASWIAGSEVDYFLQEFSQQKEVLDPEILKMPILAEKELRQIAEIIKPQFRTCELR